MLSSLSQQKASNPAYNVWVMANAGSGKTKLLIDRILRLLLSGVSAKSILCLTYTNAAASEMGERLYKSLMRFTTLPEDKLIELLTNMGVQQCSPELITKARVLFAEITENPGELQIQTIHAFCQNILQKFPIEAAVPINFNIIDDVQKQEILNQIWLEMMEEAFNSSDVAPQQGGVGFQEEQIDSRILQEEKSNLHKALHYFISHIHDINIEKWLDYIISLRFDVMRLIAQQGGITQINNNILANLSVNISAGKQEFIKQQLESIFIQQIEANMQLDSLLLLLQKCQENAKKPSVRVEKFIDFLSQYISSSQQEKYKDWQKLAKFFIKKDKSEPYKVDYWLGKKNIQQLPELEEIYVSWQDALMDLDGMIRNYDLAESSCNLLNIIYHVLGYYEFYKQSSSLVDYDDLLHKTLILLQDPQYRDWVLYQLDGNIAHILVDEAQDTNPIQWQIMRTITEQFFAGDSIERSNYISIKQSQAQLHLPVEVMPDANNSIFAVGDDKQSIYGFQGADPEGFHFEREYYRDITNNNFTDIILDKSYRSAPAILNFVDLVFNEHINMGNAHHIAHRSDDVGWVELWDLVVESDEEGEDGNQSIQDDNKALDSIKWKLPYYQDDKPSKERMLAIKIADDIAFKIGKSKINKIGSSDYKPDHAGSDNEWQKYFYTVDNDTKNVIRKRPVQAGDIMILLQKRGVLAAEIITQLKKRGIDVASSSQINITDHIVIKDLLALAEIMLLPHNDYALACLLKSPLFSLSEEGLFKLCHARATTIWHELVGLFDKELGEDYSQQYGDNLITKLHDIYIKLNKWQGYALKSKPSDFFRYILDDENIRDVFVSYHGKQVEQILLLFLDLISQFEYDNIANLQLFLSWLEQGSHTIKLEADQHGDNQVRIMTVHGAKGLQAPIVYLADITAHPKDGRQINEMNNIFIDNDNAMILAALKSSQRNDFMNVKLQEKSDRQQQEYLRLLYVAMTRAEDVLIFAGIKNNRVAANGSWYDLLKNTFDDMISNSNSENTLYDKKAEDEQNFIWNIQNVMYYSNRFLVG